MLKARGAAKTGVPVEKQQVRSRTRVAGSVRVTAPATQLFWHCKELVSELYDHLTLAQLDIHTGFGVSGYDLVRAALRCAACARS